MNASLDSVPTTEGCQSAGRFITHGEPNDPARERYTGPSDTETLSLFEVKAIDASDRDPETR